MLRFALLSLLIASQFAFGQTRPNRYILILDEAPLARQMAPSKDRSKRMASPDLVRKMEAGHEAVISRLRERQIPVTGTTMWLTNAVFVAASEAEADDLDNLPGVQRVERLRPVQMHMDRATQLVKAQEAWNHPLVGGIDNAGAGIRIGIIDTGIDHTHPAFQDPGLPLPDGYPRCVGSDCDYTNNKIIVARSYVAPLTLSGNPYFSRPDDLSPRDRVGHGTAMAAAAAGVQVNSPSGLASGIAPKAYLGNYKIWGSPGVNGTFWDSTTYEDTVWDALDDAFVDGMDIVVLPLGSPALWAASDRGAVCNLEGNLSCDFRIDAVEDAMNDGMTVVISAGNEGDLGAKLPVKNTVTTPGNAPSVITVGATTNSRDLFSSVRVPGDNVPANVQWMPTLFGNGPMPASPLTAPLRDVAATEPNGTACRPLGAGTMAGAIALIERSEDCSFTTKVNNAQTAGAVGVIVMQDGNKEYLFQMAVPDTGIPSVLIGATDGANLRNFLNANPDHPVTLDPDLESLEDTPDIVPDFSSRGPSLGDHLIKPELVAPGTGLYLATQTYDPNGSMWSPDGYTVGQGTSFSAGIVAGAAAVVQQVNPQGFSPAHIKSALVNTATDNLMEYDEAGILVPASVASVGGGKLNVFNAVETTVTVQPATLSFGALTVNNLPRTIALTFTNWANTAVNLALSTTGPGVTLGATNVALQSAESKNVVVSVNQLPGPGSYEGHVVVTGGPVTLRIPYLYLVTDGIPHNSMPLEGIGFEGNINPPQQFLNTTWLTAKVIDRYGVSVPSVPAQFEPSNRVVEQYGEDTDFLGIIQAEVLMTENPGDTFYRVDFATAPDLSVLFSGRARAIPTIAANGVVNAASNDVGPGLAPGSYISIYGTSLSDALRVFGTPYLPISLAGASVSFDSLDGAISAPGTIQFVSNNQANVQIPWEFQGLNNVYMKVSTGPITESEPYVVPLNNYSPAFFEKMDIGGSGRLVIAARNAQSGAEISSTNPAGGGDYVSLFCNGVGPVDNHPASGEPTPAGTLFWTTEIPTVTINGQAMEVQFSGLAPFFVGLYQINVRIPDGLEPGLYELVIEIGGVQSKSAFLYVG